MEHIPTVKETIVLEAHLVGYDGIFFPLNNPNSPRPELAERLARRLAKLPAQHTAAVLREGDRGWAGGGEFWGEHLPGFSAEND